MAETTYIEDLTCVDSIYGYFGGAANQQGNGNSSKPTTGRVRGPMCNERTNRTIVKLE